jgi:hypothetical protein
MDDASTEFLPVANFPAGEGSFLMTQRQFTLINSTEFTSLVATGIMAPTHITTAFGTSIYNLLPFLLLTAQT